MRIAVVGSGVSGLVAAWLLERRHEVTIFEAADQVGGHVYTVDVPEAEARREGGGSLAVDMGFIVYNERTYPLFTRLLAELGVATEESCMSFSVRSDAHDLEYGGENVPSLFAQRRNFLRPSFYRMIAGILRFHRLAPELLYTDTAMTLGEYLERHDLRGPFVERYLLPMTSAIWSTPPHQMLDFPVRTLASFLHNHGLLSLDDRPQWRVIRGGSKRWVEKLTAGLRGPIYTGSPVRSIRRHALGVDLGVASGESLDFDAVVLALHSDQALRCLGDASEAEREILGAIPYRENRVTLHTDRAAMPRRRRAWASWNYRLEPGDGEPRLTYWMNRLQNLDSRRDFLVTLNSDRHLDPGRFLHGVDLAHPQFGVASDRAKARWPEISRDRTFYCGAYWGYGFHEDGVRSGVRVAEALGVEWSSDVRRPRFDRWREDAA